LFWSLELEVSLELGCWSLELSIGCARVEIKFHVAL
jgi:hypothetical protein